MSFADGFTQADRERAIRTEVTLQQYMKSNDQKLMDMNESINKRFDDVNRRFDDVNRRFDDFNNRFSTQNQTFMWTIGILFTLYLSVLGYAVWDRKQSMKELKQYANETAEEVSEKKVKQLEQSGKVADLIKVFRKLSEKDENVRVVLQSYNLI